MQLRAGHTPPARPSPTGHITGMSPYRKVRIRHRGVARAHAPPHPVWWARMATEPPGGCPVEDQDPHEPVRSAWLSLTSCLEGRGTWSTLVSWHRFLDSSSATPGMAVKGAPNELPEWVEAIGTTGAFGAMLCRVCKVSRSAYYSWRAAGDGPSEATWEEALVVDADIRHLVPFVARLRVAPGERCPGQAGLEGK